MEKVTLNWNLDLREITLTLKLILQLKTGKAVEFSEFDPEFIKDTGY